ncbi:MAG: permease-like cell division protein FtsX [Oscillospiraceae bacterium]|nr:permease-like cell division protein FtsX [Oscillospiraceae bacterium]MBR7010625.1 permease-like cell division protein FtsX [Oscillospiraceae bacterium]
MGYLFKEGIRNMFTHGFMSFAAVCVTVACMVIIGSFSLIIYNLSILVSDMERQNRLLVCVDETYDTAEAKAVGSRINLTDNVHEAVFISREEAGRRFIEQQGGGDAFEGIDASTFRDQFEVSLEDNTRMEETIQALRQIQGVAEVKGRTELAEGFTTIQRVLNIASVAIIVVLLVVSLFMISNTIKLAMYDRRDEIAIMRMLGATNRFIRFPYFVEGFLIGMISGIVAFFLMWGLYDLLANQITRIDSLQLFNIVPFRDVLWITVATFGAAGLFVGVFGSVMSIRKFLDV